MSDAKEEVIIRNHPIYWFEDGSLVLDVETQRFKVHHTFLSRHSRFFSTSSGFKKEHTTAADDSNHTSSLNSNAKHVILEPKLQVKARDVEALLQHLYHDVHLGTDSSFSHVISLLRVSSPQQLDFPHVHEAACDVFKGLFPQNPEGFTHNHPLYDALPVARDYNLSSVRKAIFYSLVTTTEFDVTAPTTSKIWTHNM